MTSHKDYQLDQLGITSQYETDELERDLNVRFDRFTYNDREVWVQQNAYLDAHAHNHVVSESADMAGVTVTTAQEWTYHNTLGFKRRLEIADLRFSDSLQVLALERVREPDAPAVLLIALLRAHIPEKFSTNGHVCDTSKADELLSLYSQDAQRDLAAGHPTFRAIADGTYQPRSRSRSHDDPSYTDTPSAEAGFNPAHDPSAPSTPNSPHPSVRPEPVEGQFPAPSRHSRERTSPRTPIRGGNPQDVNPHSIESDHEAPFPLPDDDIEPVDPDEVAFFNLPSSERNNTPNPSAVNPPSSPAHNRPRRPFVTLFKKTRPNPNDDPDTFKIKRF